MHWKFGGSVVDKMQVKNSVLKTSYYCQSIYTSINLFNDFVEKRKYLMLDNLLIKIIDDISQCIRFYSTINENLCIIDTINSKLKLIVDGYENRDYFYIRDVFEYEIIRNIEDIFKEIKFNIENEVYDI